MSKGEEGTDCGVGRESLLLLALLLLVLLVVVLLLIILAAGLSPLEGWRDALLCLCVCNVLCEW